MKIKDDELLGQFFDTPEKKAKWLRRLTFLYIAWIIFLILGIIVFLLYWLI